MIKRNLSAEFDITCIRRDDFNLLDLNSLTEYLSQKEFDILIHTAISGGRRTKEETGKVVYENLLMFENLMKFANKFKLILNFDSGAIYDRETDIYCRREEDVMTIPKDYYGFSKYVIYNRSFQYNNVINFRIFNIFHANEESSRFIASCFDAKINGKNINISDDRFFDFMYETDFVRIVRFYFQNADNLNMLEKTINIGYKQKYRLSDIAKIILHDQSRINIRKCSNNNYSGCSDKLYQYNIGFDGLEKGIQDYEDKYVKKM